MHKFCLGYLPEIIKNAYQQVTYVLIFIAALFIITQICTNGERIENSVMYPHSIRLLSNKKELTLASHNNMVESRKH